MNPAIPTTSISTFNTRTETEAVVPSGSSVGTGPREERSTLFKLNRTASLPGVSPKHAAFANRFRKTTKAARSAITVAADGVPGSHDSMIPTSETAETPAMRHARIVQRLVTIFSEDQAREIPIHHQQQTSTEE